jgi:hypothetical protein
MALDDKRLICRWSLAMLEWKKRWHYNNQLLPKQRMKDTVQFIYYIHSYDVDKQDRCNGAWNQQTSEETFLDPRAENGARGHQQAAASLRDNKLKTCATEGNKRSSFRGGTFHYFHPAALVFLHIPIGSIRDDVKPAERRVRVVLSKKTQQAAVSRKLGLPTHIVT